MLVMLKFPLDFARYKELLYMSMKISSLIGCVGALCATLPIFADVLPISPIQKQLPLPPVEKTGGMCLMEALAQRRTHRNLDVKRELSPQLLSNLLWAANGINHESGRRTAPTARNRLEYELYIITPSGVFRYHADKHALELVLKDDLLSLSRSFGSTELLLVADKNKQKRAASRDCDAGFIGQNIYLFAAANRMGSCFRASFPAADLEAKIPLPEGSYIAYSHSLGFLKEESSDEKKN